MGPGSFSPPDDIADILAAECDRAGAVAIGLSESDLARPTRCPAWDVKTLLAHLWPDGAALVRAMLVELLGAEPPSALGWDDVAFIEAGTGRRPLTERDRTALGELAGCFPLLS